MTALEQFLEAKKNYDDIMLNMGKEVVKELFDGFLTANQTVTALQWQQYTPYFNDGEPCEFSVHSLYISFDKKYLGPQLDKPDFEDNEDGEPEGFVDSWSYSHNNKDNDVLSKPLKDLQKLMEQLEDVLRSAFGDHVQVLVTRDKIVTSEYDHE